MRVQPVEWQSFIPGIQMYKGKKTYFYNGEKIFEENNDRVCRPLIHDRKERDTWEVIIALPGVEVIPENSFCWCGNIDTVIMADTVRRIEDLAFPECRNLKFVKLPRNVEYIGEQAFWYCNNLTSVFIPPTCREIGRWAFNCCKKLIILGMPQNIQIGNNAFAYTLLMTKLPFSFELDDGDIIDPDDEATAIQWVKTINNEGAYALHRACSSFHPLAEIVHTLVKQQGIKAMKMPNTIDITPSEYLAANTFADISEKEIVNRYILDMMGEVL
ncbi:hypothetical protein CTEN210_12493 [Chaetoceros tenuissimus]|uniref:Leucine-rich repeat domain-containing protein n=1 Tax=Chaetoceros tenuissimus TaxID=426638 RepID=A0AAD3D1R8_9STRA|nr:hypothetical protein CTEN210_12493 [Chaetoceros tenuissimus]